MKPMIKYRGGKFKEFPQYERFIPKDYETYVRNRFDDLSRELAELEDVYERNQIDYKARKVAHPDKRIPNANEDLYYRLRDQYNGIAQAQYSRAALCFFINKTSYSGMLRFNAQGHFNVPFGRYEHFNTKLVTLEHSRLLQRTEILCADYEMHLEAS